MQVHAITKNIRMSAQKMREVVRQIQGLPADQAQAVLAVVPRKGARFVAKTLKSAVIVPQFLRGRRSNWNPKAERFRRHISRQPPKIGELWSDRSRSESHRQIPQHHLPENDAQWSSNFFRGLRQERTCYRNRGGLRGPAPLAKPR